MIENLAKSIQVDARLTTTKACNRYLQKVNRQKGSLKRPKQGMRIAENRNKLNNVTKKLQKMLIQHKNKYRRIFSRLHFDGANVLLFSQRQLKYQQTRTAVNFQ